MIGLQRFIGATVLALALVANSWATTVRATGSRVYMNEMLVLTLHSGDSGLIQARAEKIAAKLRKLDTAATLQLQVDGERVKIMAGDEPVMVVPHDEADAQNQTVESLGNTWLANIKAALALPAIQISQTQVKLPVSGRSQLQVVGSEVEGSQLQVSDPSVIVASRKQGTLYLRATALGASTVTIRGASGTDSLKVYVLPYAASLPQSIDAEVTGDPTTQETVQGVVEGALRTRLSCVPGSEMQFSSPTVSPLPIDQNATFTVPVRLSAPDAFPVEGNVTVTVRNTPLAYKAEKDLWYCNDPEDIKQPGNLFAAELQPDSPARLLYHHDNDTGYPMVVEVRIVNGSDLPARVVIIPGDSRPERNPVLAGMQAGDQFFRNWIKFSGEVVTIPPESVLPVSVRKLSPQQTMSGLCYLRLLGGGPERLLVRTDAMLPESVDSNATVAYDTSAPWRILGPLKLSGRAAVAELSRSVYPTPFKDQTVSYRVGGRFGFVRIGQKPISSRDDRDKLDGNFGVIYTIHAQVINPTSQAVDVEVVFESSAGYAGALFVVDGNIVRTPLLQPKEEAQIAKIHVDPGDEKSLTLLTCPLSGGSYPATITVRPLTVLASGSSTHGG